jgi:hypothetical protein
MRLLCAIFVLLIVGSLHVGGEMSNGVNVFWIPPEVETYIPVTPENIEKAAFKIVYVKNEKQANQLIGLIQKSNQVVDSKRIRVKVSADGKFYNFDSYGIGASSEGEAVMIDLKKLKLVLSE